MMRNSFGYVACLVAQLFLLGAANGAEQLPRPTIEYQADITVRSGPLTLAGQVRYTPDKEWRLLSFTNPAARGRPIIVRRDKQVVWVLNEQAKTYLQVPLSNPADAGHASGLGTLEALESLGRAVIDGVAYRKYRAVFAPGDSSQLTGEVLVTMDDIVARIEGEIAGKGDKTPYSLTLSNIERVKQDASLFELPAGYQLGQPSLADVGIKQPSRPRFNKTPGPYRVGR